MVNSQLPAVMEGQAGGYNLGQVPADVFNAAGQPNNDFGIGQIANEERNYGGSGEEYSGNVEEDAV